MNTGDELIMVVTNPDDEIVLAGKPRKLTAQECRDYMLPGWNVGTIKFSEYQKQNKKWAFEKSNEQLPGTEGITTRLKQNRIK